MTSALDIQTRYDDQGAGTLAARRMPYRIGLIVPSSNVTMERELPELFRRREGVRPERFTFHAARMRMTQVTPQALAAMNEQADRCAMELGDADCDALAYACLVAVMASGTGSHARAERRIAEVSGGDAVVTSAGALVDGARILGARRIAIITPYLPRLTDLVVDYLADHDIEVVDAISLSVADNRAVGRLDPATLPGLAARLDIGHADAVVLSACVQMPSLTAVPRVEQQLGLPVFTAAVATARRLLDVLQLEPFIPGAGTLLGPR
jgi:maleate isomerase